MDHDNELGGGALASEKPPKKKNSCIGKKRRNGVPTFKKTTLSCAFHVNLSTATVYTSVHYE